MILPSTLSSNNNNLTKNSSSSPTTSSISSSVSSTDSKSNQIININMNGSPISSSSIPMHPVATTSSSSTTSCSGMSISSSSTAGGSMTPSATTANATSNDNNKTTSTANTTSIVVDCAGCGSTIMDRYYLSAVDQHWHVSCLKCSQCKVNLQSEPSCFSRDGLIFCKSDYYRLFTMRRCSRCGEGIYASELVMRVKDHNVYHIQCFTCAWCNSTLAQGDLFGIRDNLVYCRQHYEMLSSTPTTVINNSNNISSSCPTSSLLTNNVPPPTKISPLYSLGVMAPSDVLHRHNHHHHNSSPSPTSSSPPPPPPQPPLGPILPGHHPFHHLHHSAHHHSYLNHHPSQSVHHLGHPAPPHHHHHHHHSHQHGQTGSSSPPPTMHIHDTHLTGDQCSTMAATPYTTSNTGNLPGGGGSALYSPLNLANLSIAGGTGSGGRLTPNGPITSNNNNNANNGQSPTTPQSIRKGRPRKRKNAMNNHHNSNNNHNHHLSSQQQQQQQQQDNETIVNSCSHETNTMSPQSSGRNTHSPSAVSNTLDGGGPLSGLAASIENSCNSQLSSSSNSALNLATHHQGSGSNGGGQRTKRMRTSFKHHQLRTMKTYFSVNQNPDAKDLKQLAQKTGLSKRVLQVWFQNARAKWRRNNLKMLPNATELSLNGQTMLNLGHPSTPSSTVIGSPNESTRPYSSPSPVMSPSTTDTSQLSQQHHPQQQQPPQQQQQHDHSPMMIPSLQHPGCATTPNNTNNNNNSPVSSNLKTTPTFLNGPHGPPPPLPPPVPSSMPLQPPNIAISMNFQELY